MLMESVTTTVVSLEDGGKRVILGGGSRSKVEVGYTFDIYRVNQYIGRVKIDRVETDRCFGDVEFVAPGRAVQAGDSAATRL
jgi:hypothetical protein